MIEIINIDDIESIRVMPERVSEDYKYFEERKLTKMTVKPLKSKKSLFGGWINYEMGATQEEMILPAGFYRRGWGGNAEEHYKQLTPETDIISNSMIIRDQVVYVKPHIILSDGRQSFFAQNSNKSYFDTYEQAKSKAQYLVSQSKKHLVVITQEGFDAN